MIFKLHEDYSLEILRDHQWIKVDLIPCFPISHKDEYFSIKDKEGHEIGFIKNISELDELNKELISRYLKFKVFKCEIDGIYSITEDFGIRNFHTLTNMGERHFQTALDEWPIVSDDDQIFITDVFGENFVIKNLKFGLEYIKPYI
jgi:hypothetical protein